MKWIVDWTQDHPKQTSTIRLLMASDMFKDYIAQRKIIEQGGQLPPNCIPFKHEEHLRNKPERKLSNSTRV